MLVNIFEDFVAGITPSSPVFQFGLMNFFVKNSSFLFANSSTQPSTWQARLKVPPCRVAGVEPVDVGAESVVERESLVGPFMRCIGK